MAREYATEATSGREYASEPAAQKFTPDEDTVYSPEGMPLVTPSTMQAPAGGETAAKVMTDVVSSPVRAGLAVAKPFADVAKWAGYGEPVEALKQADVGIKKQGPEALGIQSPLSTISSLAGDLYGLKSIGTIGSKLVAPMQTAIPAIETASKWLASKPAMQSILGGAGIGVLGADPNAGSAVTEGAAGATLAGATHGLIKGLGAAADPALARLKKLEQLGYDKAQIIKDSTLGQLLGGGMQKVENFLNAIPFSGVSSKISEGVKSFKNMTEAKLSALDAQKAAGIEALDLAAQKTKADSIKALEDKHMQNATNLEIEHAQKAAQLKEEESGFHRPFVDRALSYLGPDYALKPGLKGHELLDEGQKSISKAYEDALKDIGNMRLPKQAKKELQDVVDSDVTALGGEGSKLHNLLSSKVDSLLATANKGNWLSPQNWQDQLSALTKEAYKSKLSDDPFTNNYGRALDDLKEKWIGLIEDTSGSELFKNANKAFSEFKVPEKAASYVSSLKNAGEFNPNDLLRAIASESTTKRLAGGQNELQQLAQKGYAEMMAKRQALDDTVKTGKKTLAQQHEAEKDLLKQYHDLTERNIKLRQNALKSKTDVEKDVLSKTAKDVESHPVGSYGEHRAMYNLSGVGALTGGGMAASHFLSLPPELQAALGGTLLAGTHALYNRPVQTLLKKAATAERPEWMKQVGQALKENAPLGALTAVEDYESMRKKPRAGVTVYDPNTGNQISPSRQYDSDVPKVQGNLP